MTTALRLLCCVLLFAGLSARAIAQSVFTHPAKQGSTTQPPQLPQIEFKNLTSLVVPAFRPTFYPELLAPPLMFADGASAALYRAITIRLGMRYRFFGTDDRGYDCSGFVWRVFQDAGADFERVAARVLWNQLPEARGEEINRFGTLVFFNGLKHVGIVRDGLSFYHASRREGVTLSSFAGYWSSRITGYRRAPANLKVEEGVSGVAAGNEFSIKPASLSERTFATAPALTPTKRQRRKQMRTSRRTGHKKSARAAGSPAKLARPR